MTYSIDASNFNVSQFKISDAFVKVFYDHLVTFSFKAIISFILTMLSNDNISTNKKDMFKRKLILFAIVILRKYIKFRFNFAMTTLIAQDIIIIM